MIFFQYISIVVRSIICHVLFFVCQSAHQRYMLRKKNKTQSSEKCIRTRWTVQTRDIFALEYLLGLARYSLSYTTYVFACVLQVSPKFNSKLPLSYRHRRRQRQHQTTTITSTSNDIDENNDVKRVYMKMNNVDWKGTQHTQNRCSRMREKTENMRIKWIILTCSAHIFKMEAFSFLLFLFTHSLCVYVIVSCDRSGL